MFTSNHDHAPPQLAQLSHHRPTNSTDLYPTTLTQKYPGGTKVCGRTTILCSPSSSASTVEATVSSPVHYQLQQQHDPTFSYFSPTNGVTTGMVSRVQTNQMHLVLCCTCQTPDLLQTEAHGLPQPTFQHPSVHRRGHALQLEENTTKQVSPATALTTLKINPLFINNCGPVVIMS